MSNEFLIKPNILRFEERFPDWICDYSRLIIVELPSLVPFNAGFCEWKAGRR